VDLLSNNSLSNAGTLVDAFSRAYHNYHFDFMSSGPYLSPPLAKTELERLEGAAAERLMSTSSTSSRSSAKTSPKRATTSRFEGQVAIVTGASDRGIGGAIADRLVAEGASVCLLSPHRPDQLLDRIEELETGDARWIECDFCEPGAIEIAVEAVVDEYANIDVLVNNSGVDTAGSFDTLKDEDWQRMLDVNLTGALRMTRTVLPMLAKNRGAVVNVASASAMGGTPGLAAYSATKAGMIGLTQSLAAELAPRNIRVNAVCPAMVKTPMVTQYATQLTSESWEQIKSCHPLGIGMPQDVAAAVAFLASADARWISGIALPLGWMPSFPLPMSTG